MSTKIRETNTSTILTEIQNAIKAKDALRLGQNLVILAENEGKHWLTLLYLKQIIPDPNTKKFTETLRILADGLSEALQYVSFSSDNYIKLFLPLLSLNIIFTQITDRLEKLPVWEKPAARTIFRIATFVEDQWLLADKKLKKTTKTKGYFDPNTALTDELITTLGSAKTSIVAGYEENCENLQLILAYVLYRFGSDFSGKIGICNSPYEDADFTMLISLASLWNYYKYIWENVKYLGWHPIIADTPDKEQLYIPSDYDEFIRCEIGKIRRSRIKSDTAIINSREKKPSGYYSNTPSQINEITKTILIPDVGDIWNAEVDTAAIKSGLKRTWNSTLVETLIEQSHYQSLLSDVELGTPGNGIPWNVYWKSIDALKLLAEAIEIAFEHQVKSGQILGELRKVLTVRKSQLVQLLSEVTGIESDNCLRAVELLTFNPQLRHLEIWDTPFISVDKQTLLFVPTLIKMSDPVRALENFIAQWANDLFAKRGKRLEKQLSDFLKRVPGIKVQSPVNFKIDDTMPVECDLVVWWDEHLIFIEAKCTKSIFNAFDVYRARERINEAIDQLILRRKLALENWTAFREATSDLGLPSQPPAFNKIQLIAVTNVLHFTGLVTQDVIVTDEFCLRRFFGPSDIEMFVGQESFGVMGKIRESQIPKATEFFTYLKDPPQVSSVRDYLKVEPMLLTAVSETAPKIAVLHASYVPPENQLVTSNTQKQSTGRKILRNALCPCGSGRKYKHCCGKRLNQ